jgi:hypothetical protein
MHVWGNALSTSWECRSIDCHANIIISGCRHAGLLTFALQSRFAGCQNDFDMNESTKDAQAEFGRARDRVKRALETTPDDRINWSPAPSARTPIHQVVHSALAIDGMRQWFSGTPFPFANITELDEYSRNEEVKFSSRDEALRLFDKNSDEFTAWLDSLTPEQLQSEVNTPGGSVPLAYAITFPADHCRSHAAQMEYIQTAYGDRDWHMG